MVKEKRGGCGPSSHSSTFIRTHVQIDNTGSIQRIPNRIPIRADSMVQVKRGRLLKDCREANSRMILKKSRTEYGCPAISSVLDEEIGTTKLLVRRLFLSQRASM